MNNDAPQTLDAAGSRVAELEQQLRLSDEGCLLYTSPSPRDTR